MAWTATGTLCCRLIRLPSARCPPPSLARCSATSAARSPDAVDIEYADLNLRPLYPIVCTPPFFPLSLSHCCTNPTAHPSLYAEGPASAHPAAREPSQLILLRKVLPIPPIFYDCQASTGPSRISLICSLLRGV